MCKEEKEDTEFAWKNKTKGRLSTHCRACQKQYRDAHYQNNRQLYIDKAAAWKQKEKIRFYTWLRSQMCADCGNDDFRVLECDHLGDKDYNIGPKIGLLSLEEIQKEVAKCDIVCSNCHKIRTAERGGFYKYLAL